MSSFIIRSVLASNFKGIERKEFKDISDFELLKMTKAGLVLLAGPNGYGKTTIFDIIEILLTKNVTRINSTKFGNRNLTDSGLLNDENHYGYIGIVFENTKDYTAKLTLIGRINHGQVRDINSSISNIELYYKNGEISNDELNNNFDIDCNKLNKIDKISDLEEFDVISKDIYNLFYYVSQEESTHFLKQKENDKVSTFDSLVSIDTIVSREDSLNKMLGGRTNDSLDKHISKLEEDLKTKIKENRNQQRKKVDVAFESLFLSDVKWDQEDLSKYNLDELEMFLSELKSIDELVKAKNEFKKHLDIKKVESSLANKNNFNCFMALKKYNLLKVNDIGYDEEALNALVLKTENNIFIKIIQSKFKKNNFEDEITFEDIKKCAKIVKVEIDLCKDEYETNVSLIKSKEKLQGENDKLLGKLINIRHKFVQEYTKFCDKDLIGEFNLDNSKCPLCGTGFVNGHTELIDEIDSTTELLKKINSTTIEEISTLRFKIISKMEILTEELDVVTEDASQILISSENISTLKTLSSDKVSKENYVRYSKFVLEIIPNLFDILVETSDNLSELLLKNIGELSNEFYSQDKEYKFDEKYKKYFMSSWSNYVNFIENTSIENDIFENKKKFIDNFIIDLDIKNSEKLNLEISDIAKQIVIYEEIKNMLGEYRTIHSAEIKKFRETVMKDIEIPLYIYTGKILQNYQRGLGVFIKNNKSRINFVPDFNSDHEIINTFSSGQLSGFVISFLLVMNKVYTMNKNRLNTVLIDDPVQTMDDINIASLVEVLRSEFKEKQLIISTHEDNKASYIMYKFLKHGIDYEYIDVKKEIYPMN